MSEEIDLGGIKVPAKDWEATPESIKLVLMFLLEEHNQMKLKIESLEEKLNKNSQNSSIPPSSPRWHHVARVIRPGSRIAQSGNASGIGSSSRN